MPFNSPDEPLRVTAYTYKEYFYDPDDSEIASPIEYLLCQFDWPDGLGMSSCNVNFEKVDPLGILTEGNWCTVLAEEPNPFSDF